MDFEQRSLFRRDYYGHNWYQSLYFVYFVPGYGNIVPATSTGRIACVLFALFGAPLAISQFQFQFLQSVSVTIGDLGKFLSECTIWLYKQMKKAKVQMRSHWRRFRVGKGEKSLKY